MAKRQVSQWGIQFGVAINAAGYEWRPRMPHDGEFNRFSREDVVLAPAGSVRETESGSFAVSAKDVQKSESGLGIARRAFDGFRVLARQITRSEPLGTMTWTNEHGTYTIESDLMRRLTVSDEECRTLIVNFANTYGTLWGDNSPGTLGEWRKEAATFLDLYDVAKALVRPGSDFREFDSRVFDQGGGRGLQYMSHLHSSRSLTIATEGEVIQERSAKNALPKTTDFYARAKEGSSRERARMLLSRQINKKLAGGLSLRASLISESNAFVEPDHLIHLLYTRMWLDTVNREGFVRERTCKECGRVIDGKTTSRRQFCNDACRTEFNNRRRARSH